jgi:hypothetical protein
VSTASTRVDALPFKTCGCGRKYDRPAWDALPDRKTYDDGTGALLEQRSCPCFSSIVVTLVEATTVDDLRRAVKIIDYMNESFNQEYTGQELLRLIKVCWSSGWDVTPDEWTPRQVARALEDGTPPTFEEGSGGLHALDVDDCFCRGCRANRRIT